jgi:DNA-binding MarR family transcriptional regulator
LNKLFWLIWGIYKNFLSNSYAILSLAHVKLGIKFGAKTISIGDSNHKTKYKFMNRFPFVALNIALPGTRVEHTFEFLTQTDEGKEITRLIHNYNLTVYINSSGNNVLQDSMDTLEQGLKNLYLLFPKAKIFNIPFVYANFLAKLSGKSEDMIRAELSRANEIIDSVYDKNVIDVSDITEYEGQPIFFLFSDAVHYSDVFEKRIRIPYIIEREKLEDLLGG